MPSNYVYCMDDSMLRYNCRLIAQVAYDYGYFIFSSTTVGGTIVTTIYEVVTVDFIH